MRIFAENENCAVSSRLVFMGKKEDRATTFEPDYSIFTDPQNHRVVAAAQAARKRFLINKDELGHDLRKHECDYNLFPDPTCYRAVKPAFLFRDPVRIFDSWKALGWNDLDSLRSCMAKLEKMLQENECSYAVIYERLVQRPDVEIQALCSWWDVPFEHNMLRFQKQFGDFFFQSDRERSIYCVENPQGLFDTVKTHSEIVSTIQSHQLLTQDELETVENSMGKQYLQLWGSKFNEIQATLRSKTCFAFDLDDTLHEFRKASSSAVLAVLTRINADHHGTSIAEMQNMYHQILADKTASAFVDGRTSREYRKERFETLTQKLQLSRTDNADDDNKYFDSLADIYEAALATSLRLKSGALSLLTTLKNRGKKIAIITEGPEDAQIWTLHQLGLHPYVDFLATTNRFRTSKVGGLLRKVLNTLNIGTTDVVYIGDSWPRDMEPAIEEGVLGIHYSEMDNISLDLSPIRVNSLWKVKHLLGGEGGWLKLI